MVTGLMPCFFRSFRMSQGRLTVSPRLNEDV
jgi:hypothetical protein